MTEGLTQLAQAEFSSHFPPATVCLGCGPRSLKSGLWGGPTLLLSTVEEAPPPGSLDLAGALHFLPTISQLHCNWGSKCSWPTLRCWVCKSRLIQRLWGLPP